MANAVNLPYGMKFNIQNNEEKFENIARAMKLKKKNGKAVLKHLFELNKKIGLPKKARKSRRER
jgi:alcohol dehydrogenase class IV